MFSAMEAPEDVMGSHSSSSTGTIDHCPPHPTVLKRKRSKRPPPPRALLVAASSSSTSSADYLSTTTTEEEDTAHCLILLAQGRALVDSSPPPPAEKLTSRRFTETTTTAGGKAGFYVYECKTCNKCFPSFQALGGHRTSHKKKMAIPTLTTAEDKNLTMNDNIVEGEINISINDFSKPASAVNIPTANSPINNKVRVHECSICGAEFSSGQALGGHMRRHRPIGAGPESSLLPTQEVVLLKKERNVLSLDLNLPAPAVENPQPLPVTAAFSFTDKRPMVFSATSGAALVDCHY